jgi:hypothetical protein
MKLAPAEAGFWNTISDKNFKQTKNVSLHHREASIIQQNRVEGVDRRRERKKLAWLFRFLKNGASSKNQPSTFFSCFLTCRIF